VITVVGSSYVSSPYWTSRGELEKQFGAENVAQWADLSNQGNSAEVASVIQYAMRAATDDAKSRILGAPCGPITTPPALLRFMVTRLAGVYLYTNRGVQDSSDEDGKHRFSAIEKSVNKWFQSVVAGQVPLGSVDAGITSVPVVVPNSDPNDVVYVPGSQYGLDGDPFTAGI
jgi:phage gp36-like protein